MLFTNQDCFIHFINHDVGGVGWISGRNTDVNTCEQFNTGNLYYARDCVCTMCVWL